MNVFQVRQFFRFTEWKSCTTQMLTSGSADAVHIGFREYSAFRNWLRAWVHPHQYHVRQYLLLPIPGSSVFKISQGPLSCILRFISVYRLCFNTFFYKVFHYFICTMFCPGENKHDSIDLSSKDQQVIVFLFCFSTKINPLLEWYLP